MEVLRHLFSQSRPLRRVFPLSLATGAYGALVYFVELRGGPMAMPRFEGELAAALSFVLGLILVFRTNRAYERWWEARTLWGNLVNASRNLAVKAAALGAAETAERSELGRLVAGFPYALRDHLMGPAARLAAVPGFEAETAQPRHVPLFLADRIYAQLARWKERGALGVDDLIVLDRDAARLLDIVGGCERIRNTPMPVSYRMFTGFALLGYALVLPWTLVETLRLFTVPVVAVFAYFMIGLEAIARSVEHPFGRDEDHLELDRLCEVIRESVAAILPAEGHRADEVREVALGLDGSRS